MIVGLVIGALALTILNLDGNVTAGTAVAVMGLSIGGGSFRCPISQNGLHLRSF